MYVEGGWKPPRQEPPPRSPRMTDREERTIMALVIAFAVLMLIAPIGGATIVQGLLHALGLA